MKTTPSTVRLLCLTHIFSQVLPGRVTSKWKWWTHHFFHKLRLAHTSSWECYVYCIRSSPCCLLLSHQASKTKRSASFSKVEFRPHCASMQEWSTSWSSYKNGRLLDTLKKNFILKLHKITLSKIEWKTH